jgi:nucleotide-binding universal stress UspA family protein
MINLKRILVPTDFSESANHALRYGISFASEYKAELTLLHVVETLSVGYASDLFPVPIAEVLDEISSYAKGELAKLAELARERGVTVQEVVIQGKPAAEVIRYAHEQAIDMIVLGTHGRGVLDHALFGSTTERVVRKAPCPVLTCRLAEHEFVDEK